MNLFQTFVIILDDVRPALEALPEEFVKKPIADGKWSPIQIIGHLCDSGVNNLSRVVRAQKTDDLIFDGYDQEFWVEANDYQNAEWGEVIGYWFSINRRFANVIKNMPEAILDAPREKHSISWPLYAEKEDSTPFTLRFLIVDYIGHMENHLKQVFADYKPLVLKA